MANEYQVSALLAEVLTTEDQSPAAVSALLAEVLATIDPGFGEISALYVEVLCSLVEVATNAAFVDDGVADDVNPISVFPLYSVGYVDEGDNDLVYPISHVGAKFTVKDVERNPYPARLPTDQAEQQETLSEQQRIIREQHNKSQAGDTTFDYGLLLKYETTQQFTLGSLGRFYHPEYGLIMARYVQFTQCVDSVVQGQPVGRPKKATTVDWQVTNDYSKSGRDLVMGVTFLASTPEEGSFGWMVVMGANPTQIGSNSAVVPAQDAEYSWSGLGELGLNVEGKIVARGWGKPNRSGIQPGQIFITLETMSLKDFEREVRRTLALEIAAVAQHENRLDLIEDLLDTATHAASTAAQNYQALLTWIAKEEQTRAAADLEIRSLLSGATHDWSVDILTAANAVRGEFVTADDLLSVRIDTAQARADAAYSLASSIDLLPLSSGITSLGLRVTLLETALAAAEKGIWAPLTTGAIPAEFIVDDDGQCIMVEIP